MILSLIEHWLAGQRSPWGHGRPSPLPFAQYTLLLLTDQQLNLLQIPNHYKYRRKIQSLNEKERERSKSRESSPSVGQHSRDRILFLSLLSSVTFRRKNDPKSPSCSFFTIISILFHFLIFWKWISRHICPF